MYLYNENSRTGQRRYYSLAGDGLQAAGAPARDLFGAGDSAVQIVVPSLNDFVLLGSATDCGVTFESITAPRMPDLSLYRLDNSLTLSIHAHFRWNGLPRDLESA